MEELQRHVDAQADRLDREYEALMRLIDEGVTDDTVRLALSQAKRVRRESALLVRVLAQARDRLDTQNK